MTRFGPEIGFGITMHKHLNAPILLVKYAWEGQDTLQDYATRKKPEGLIYDQMITTLKSCLNGDGIVLDHLIGHNPKKGFQIRGFVWFHGFNDFHDHEANLHYTSNLFKFTNDLMNTFKEMYNDRINYHAGMNADEIVVGEETKEEEPMFVIGEFAFLGEKEAQKHDAIVEFRRKQHRVVSSYAKIADHTRVVKLAHLWDDEAANLAIEGGGSAFKKIGSEINEQHYYGSGRFTYKIGEALAENTVAMLRGYEPIMKHKCYFKQQENSGWW